MGARPVLALNLVAYPDTGVPEDSLAELLRGGAEKATEAGVTIIGGHTIVDKEPKYGMAVTGFVHPGRIVQNSTARPGDALILTKPIGIGIITTGVKRGLVSDDELRPAIKAMATLNEAAAHAMIEVGVSAATDITGYGLLGHLYEMTSGSRAGARIRQAAVPVHDIAWRLVEAGAVPGGTQRNWHYLDEVRQGVRWGYGITTEQKLVLCDAQTSGGLLIAVPQERKDALKAALAAHGVATIAEIGEITDDPTGTILVE